MSLAASLVVAIVNVHAYAPLCEKMKLTPGSEFAILGLGLYYIFPLRLSRMAVFSTAFHARVFLELLLELTVNISFRLHYSFSVCYLYTAGISHEICAFLSDKKGTHTRSRYRSRVQFFFIRLRGIESLSKFIKVFIC